MPSPDLSLSLHPYALSVSPEQYAWLFDDLKEFTPDQAVRHYEEFGRAELCSLRRRPDPVRLLTLRAQLLSSFPHNVPPAYIAFKLGPEAGLDIYFSTVGVAAGRFYFAHVAGYSPNICLFLNTAGMDWYHSGIPGIAHDIPSTISWLRQLIAELQPRQIRCFGGSMSAYAAILFGSAINADSIHAFDPEIQLGRRHTRSRLYELVEGVKFDKRYVDLFPDVLKLGSKLKLYFSGWDVVEARWVYMMRRAKVEFFLLRIFHGQVANAFDWEALMGANVLSFSDGVKMPDGHALESSVWMHKAYVAASHHRYDQCQAAINQAFQISGNEGLLVYRTIVNYLLGDMIAAKEDAEKFSAQYQALGLKSLVPIEAIAANYLFTDAATAKNIAQFWANAGLKKMTRKLFFRSYVKAGPDP